MVALLNEVYGEDFMTSSSNIYPSEFYESHDDMIEDMVNDEPYHEYIQENKVVNKKIKETFQDNQNNIITCELMNNHMESCNECQKKMKTKYTSMEPYKKKILDIIIYVLSGLFILLLLDIFVRLGKVLK